MSVDTACSSSLVACHLAMAELRPTLHGPTRRAVVAGVHIQATATSSSYVHAAGMLSPQGRCQVLDASADGYVRGEAALAMVITPCASSSPTDLSSATGLLLIGSAVNQDGRSSGLTAPNGPAQQQCIRLALRAAATPAARVDLLSLHGTGEREGGLNGADRINLR